MKARKILALILAVLMVLGAMPLAFIAASADGTAISAPATLPDGETYIGTEFLLDSYDILADYQAKKGVEGAKDVTNMGWIGSNLLGAGASDAVRRGARQLESYESQLGLLKRYRRLTEGLSEGLEALRDATGEEAQRARDILARLLSEEEE